MSNVITFWKLGLHLKVTFYKKLCFLLDFPDYDLWVKVSCRDLDPVDISHEDRMFKFDVRLVLILQLFRIESANAGTYLLFKQISIVCIRKLGKKLCEIRLTQ